MPSRKHTSHKSAGLDGPKVRCAFPRSRSEVWRRMKRVRKFPSAPWWRRGNLTERAEPGCSRSPEQTLLARAPQAGRALRATGRRAGPRGRALCLHGARCVPGTRGAQVLLPTPPWKRPPCGIELAPGPGSHPTDRAHFASGWGTPLLGYKYFCLLLFA